MIAIRYKIKDGRSIGLLEVDPPNKDSCTGVLSLNLLKKTKSLLHSETEIFLF